MKDLSCHRLVATKVRMAVYRAVASDVFALELLSSFMVIPIRATQPASAATVASGPDGSGLPLEPHNSRLGGGHPVQ
ncbi:MAG: hypothetical protein M1115_09460 [Actinobacteria bacterium]|nr:hypothetical protein [Actinomycetota bacterium]